MSTQPDLDDSSLPTDRPPPDPPVLTASTPAWKKAEPRAAIDGYQDFIAFLTYIEEVSEAPASELHALAASLGPDAEEAYMTTADTFRAEGRAEGLAEGRAEGRTQARAEMLVDVLTARFGPLPDSVTDTVQATASDRLRAWTLRAVTAETLAEVFA